MDELMYQIKTALNCDPKEFAEKYNAYKQAEYEFNKIYEPFKDKLIELYETQPDYSKHFTLGDVEITYVAPTVRTSVDTKKLKEEEPELIKKYTKHTTVKASLRLDKNIYENIS